MGGVENSSGNVVARGDTILQCSRILGGRKLLVYVRIVVVALTHIENRAGAVGREGLVR